MSKFTRHYVCMNCHAVKTPLQMKNPRVCIGCAKKFAYISIGKVNAHSSKTVICDHHWPFDCRC
jgi:hypothetical protein